jgi:diacylglycerol kinase (ATP)
VYLIVNATAGGGKGARRARLFQRRLQARGIAHSMVFTEGPGHATTLAGDAVRSSARAIIAVGGDGTIHEVADGVLRATRQTGLPAPPLGVLPVGTGNDFAKQFPGTRDPVQLYDALRTGAVLPLDVLEARWNGTTEYCLNALGIGIDVEVARSIRRLPLLPGVASYVAGVLRALVRYRALPVRLELDDAVWEGRVMVLAVMNGTTLGGGFRLCPEARSDDGILDVCIIRELGALGIARTMPRTLRGTHGDIAEVSLRTGHHAALSRPGDEPLRFELDGELRQATPGSRLEVSVLPAALHLLAAGKPVHGTLSTGKTPA